MEDNVISFGRAHAHKAQLQAESETLEWFRVEISPYLTNEQRKAVIDAIEQKDVMGYLKIVKPIALRNELRRNN